MLKAKTYKVRPTELGGSWLIVEDVQLLDIVNELSADGDSCEVVYNGELTATELEALPEHTGW